MNSEKYLSIKNLEVEYVTSEETVYAVNGVSFDMRKGRTLGLVGETGAGRTTIAKAVMRILQTPPFIAKNEKIWLEGRSLMALSEKEVCRARGDQVTMIFQNPVTTLNPTMKMGRQIEEIILHHEKLTEKEAHKRAEEILEVMGVPIERYDEYPHQFSGGMKQRVVITIALACNPDLLLADEPATALDVTIQAQVLDMMRELHRRENTTTILVTHDLGVVAEMCDDVAIVYAGEIVEKGTLRDIFKQAAYPYTRGLFVAIPHLHDDKECLTPIEGLPPDPTKLSAGCKFHLRCPAAQEACRTGEIPELEIPEGHYCKCLFAGKGETDGGACRD